MCTYRDNLHNICVIQFVAHNAAFDMKLLQLKEELTGLKFDHPVMDTLLLSSVVHPNLEGYKVMAPLAEKAIAEALKRK